VVFIEAVGVHEVGTDEGRLSGLLRSRDHWLKALSLKKDVRKLTKSRGLEGDASWEKWGSLSSVFQRSCMPTFTSYSSVPLPCFIQQAR
jgi:hypothetical protein